MRPVSPRFRAARAGPACHGGLRDGSCEYLALPTMCEIRLGQPAARQSIGVRFWLGASAFCVVGLLAGCGSQPLVRSANGRVFDAKLGVWASPRVVADGDAVPRGGGAYLTGRPYVIGGQTYVPNQNPKGYTAVGTASWYGDAFHGRRTANGEVFDKGSVSAAHPTLPLPSYVRVTNLKNGRSVVVRVNDRGPYHGGRVMDVSQRVAEALMFRGEGTARVRIDYVGRAPLQGSDDDQLMATLRTDGGPAQLAGAAAETPVVSARADDETASRTPQPGGQPGAIRQPEPLEESVSRRQSAGTFAPRRDVPLPPQRPFTLGQTGAGPVLLESRPQFNRLASLITPSTSPLAFAAAESEAEVAAPFARMRDGAAVPLGANWKPDR